MKRAILTMLVAGLLTACAGDFSPTINDSGGDTTGMTVGTTDGSTATDTDDTDGSTTGATDTDDGTTGPELDMGGTDTGDPEMPGPNEPCDPMLAADGTAPCFDPEVPNKVYSCAPVQFDPPLDDLYVEFHCVPMSDAGGDGYDIGSPCSDGSSMLNGGTKSGCENAFCLWNGLATSLEFDTYQNHPPDACPWQPDGPDGALVKGCCASYCDPDHACENGWHCEPFSSNGLQDPVDHPDVGTCVWNG